MNITFHFIQNQYLYSSLFKIEDIWFLRTELINQSIGILIKFIVGTRLSTVYGNNKEIKRVKICSG